MNELQAIILGLVEGVTEFLPISSTGHLILTSELLNLADTEFLKTFEIAVQSGAILAVVALYWRTLRQWSTIKRLAVAFLPTAVIGLALYKLVKTYLLGNTTVVLYSLALGGIILILFELRYKRKKKVDKEAANAISYKQAFGVGLFQALAIIPGVSRSGATIVGGLSLGLSRRAITEFSFLLAVPTMLSATGLDIIKADFVFTSAEVYALALGSITSFVTAALAIKWLLKFVPNHTFIGFGVYRVVLAIVFTYVWFY